MSINSEFGSVTTPDCLVRFDMFLSYSPGYQITRQSDLLRRVVTTQLREEYIRRDVIRILVDGSANDAKRVRF